MRELPIDRKDSVIASLGCAQILAYRDHNQGIEVSTRNLRRTATHDQAKELMPICVDFNDF